MRDLEEFHSIDDVFDMRESLQEWDSASARLKDRQMGEEDEIVGRPRRRVPSPPGKR